MLILAALTLNSCDKTEDNDNVITVYLNQTEIPYDTAGVWSEAMTIGANIISQGIVFSHDAIPDWGVWNGFVASRSQDVTDYSSDFSWLEHQTIAITGGGLSGLGTPYLAAYWNSSEGEDVNLATASCSFKYGNDGKTFIPQSIHVTNTTYSYYSMLNGSPYSRKFAAGDYFNLLAYGVAADGTKTGPVKFSLADYASDDSKPISTWEYMNLEELGEVVGVYFQMESSDTGMFGINNPTYFAADRLVIKLM